MTRAQREIMDVLEGRGYMFEASDGRWNLVDSEDNVVRAGIRLPEIRALMKRAPTVQEFRCFAVSREGLAAYVAEEQE